ncbi:helix-turn-helix transcriptional regulator [Thiovibrio sp. JS02]
MNALGDKLRWRLRRPLSLTGGTLLLCRNWYTFTSVLTDIRLYALHRIKESKRLYKASLQPEKFSLDEYLATGALDFGDGEFIRFEAYVTKDIVSLLQETPLSNDMKIRQKNNRLWVGCTVVDSWQLHWWILSQGDNIEVIAPASLRSSIIEDIRAMGAVYGL